MKTKKRDLNLKGYSLVPETTGKITNGVYIRDDGRALIIKFAWGKNLHFKPQDEIPSQTKDRGEK